MRSLSLAAVAALAAVSVAACIDLGPSGAEGSRAEDTGATDGTTSGALPGVVPAPAPSGPPAREPSCTTATWTDASLFQQATRLDDGDPFADHDVQPGLSYKAPRPSPLPWPIGNGSATVRSVTHGSFEDLAALRLRDEVATVEVVGADEAEARGRAKEFLAHLSPASAQDVDAWSAGMRTIGHVDGTPLWAFDVAGPFHLPDALAEATLESDMVRDGELDDGMAGGWRATLSLPFYRVSPAAGYIDASAGGHVQASLPPEPTLQEAVRETLAPFGVVPAGFDGWVDFRLRGGCGQGTLG